MANVFGLSLLALLASVHAAEQDYVRANPEECASDDNTINFLTYAQGLPGTAVTCTEAECDLVEQQASFFNIRYFETYKAVSYQDSSGETLNYILYHCGTEQPDDAYIQGLDGQVGYFEIPLTAVATGDSTAAWLLEELGVEDRVRWSSTYATSPCMLKVAAPEADGGCGRAFAKEDDWTDPPYTDQSSYDVEFSFSGNLEKREVLLRTSQDPGPLRRAEHIVYVSTFFNKEAQALEYYQNVADTYIALTENTTAPADQPVVAWMSYNDITGSGYTDNNGFNASGMAATISFAQYKTSITIDGGAKMPDQAALEALNGTYVTNDDVGIPMSAFQGDGAFAAALKEQFKLVDIMIEESFMGPLTLEEFVALFNITAEEEALIPFLANDKLYRHDKDQTTTFSDDWFGEGVVRPDLVLGDVRAIVSPDQYPDHPFKFFRNIALGENQTFTGLEDCTDLECSAYDEQAPIMVGAAGVAEESGQRGVAASAAGALGAAVAAAVVVML